MFVGGIVVGAHHVVGLERPAVAHEPMQLVTGHAVVEHELVRAVAHLVLAVAQVERHEPAVVEVVGHFLRRGTAGWKYSLDSLWMNTASGRTRRIASSASRFARAKCLSAVTNA